jgi:hypothetical protein
MVVPGIDYSTIKKFNEFRNSLIYRHVKLVAPKGLSDEELVVFALSQHETCAQSLSKQKNFIEYCYFLNDSHVHMLEADKPVSYLPIQGKLFDGIYDIWLKECNNVGKISLVFNDLEIPIDNFKPNADTIQIPLTFMTDSQSHISHFFNYEYSWCSKKMSYIPTVALPYTKFGIKLNPGASAKMYISTIYLPKQYRKILVHSQNVFFVNGKPLITRCGEVHPYTEEKCSCTIC